MNIILFRIAHDMNARIAFEQYIYSKCGGKIEFLYE